ncbi:MAG: archaellin/type IV pilin N-terminal domain-containing protein, partial [Candidatus Aenigmatarchaeota archaeon]
MSIFSKRGSKGISPLIAAVLLIAFTMTVAAILATWAQTFGQQKIQEAGKRGTQAIECPALSVRIESASWQNNQIQVVAWNTGDYNLTNIDLIV